MQDLGGRPSAHDNERFSGFIDLQFFDYGPLSLFAIFYVEADPKRIVLVYSELAGNLFRFVVARIFDFSFKCLFFPLPLVWLETFTVVLFQPKMSGNCIKNLFRRRHRKSAEFPSFVFVSDSL